MKSDVKENWSVSEGTRRRLFFNLSGLEPSSLEIKINPDKPDRFYIVYRDPITREVMKTPAGKPFRRWRQFGPKGSPKYLTCKGGDIRLYFPNRKGIYNVDFWHKFPDESISEEMNVIEFLLKYPDEPLYIVEGEKKAAKAWQEGIPCIGISGIWCWLANKEDRCNNEKILHPDFDLIPGLEHRSVIMIYDSDANDPKKKEEFNECSEAFETCLQERGVTRYEKIVLPREGSKKVGLDDYLMKHSVTDFERLVAEQSKTVPLHQYIMTAEQFTSANFPPINFIIQPWLTDCQLTMIHSAPGVGKTFFLLGMSAAITRKKPPEEFCGWKIKKGANVLFIDGEMPAPEMQNRLAMIEAAYRDNPRSAKNRFWFLSCTHLSRQTGRSISFSDEHYRQMFYNILVNHPAEVVILDNIVSLIGTKDENDAGAWSVMNDWLLSLRAIPKSIILVHHSSKKGQQRGTSHRSDNLDTVLRLEEKDKDEFIVHFEKHRNFSSVEASPIHIKFQMDEETAVFAQQEIAHVERKDRNREIWKLYKTGMPQKEIAKHFGLTEGRISHIIKEKKKEIKDEDE